MKAIIVVDSFQAEYHECGSHQIQLTLDIDERELHSFTVDHLLRECAECGRAPVGHAVEVAHPATPQCGGYKPADEGGDG